MSDPEMVPGGNVETSIISESAAQVESEHGLVNETTLVFSLPPEITKSPIDEPIQHGAFVAPTHGTVNEAALVDGLNETMGPEGASKSAKNVGSLLVSVQKAMTVHDYSTDGVRLNRLTNKPIQEVKNPEFIPAGTTIADMAPDKRATATKLVLGH